jgi:hypothetical protein
LRKILITAANTAHAYLLANLIKDEEIIFADSTLQKFLIPKYTSPSFAHELLSLSLDHHIDCIFPIHKEEIELLSESKILFSEYGIDIIIPDLIQLQNLKEAIYPHKSNFAAVSSFSELSKSLISLGYPDKVICVGKRDHESDFILIDDSNKEPVNIWKNNPRISFIQLSKILNKEDFEPLEVYPLEDEIIKIQVLSYQNQFRYIQKINEQLQLIINEALIYLKIQGFFEVTLAGDKILRIKPNN